VPAEYVHRDFDGLHVIPMVRFLVKNALQLFAEQFPLSNHLARS